MPAFSYEYGLAKADGVRFEWFAQPMRVLETGVEFLRTTASDSSRRGQLDTIPGSNFVIAADMVVKALGQEPLIGLLGALPGLAHNHGKIVVDATGATSIPKLFAGGDCLRTGGEVVDAVRDGKKAAIGINHFIMRTPKCPT